MMESNLYPCTNNNQNITNLFKIQYTQTCNHKSLLLQSQQRNSIFILVIIEHSIKFLFSLFTQYQKSSFILTKPIVLQASTLVPTLVQAVINRKYGIKTEIKFLEILVKQVTNSIKQFIMKSDKAQSEQPIQDQNTQNLINHSNTDFQTEKVIYPSMLTVTRGCPESKSPESEQKDKINSQIIKQRKSSPDQTPSLTNSLRNIVLHPAQKQQEQMQKQIRVNRQAQLTKKLFVSQKEVKNNLLKIQKYFKNVSAQDKEQVVFQLQLIKKKVLQLHKKHCSN